MKKEYEELEIVVLDIQLDDVITTSGDPVFEDENESHYFGEDWDF